MIYENSNFVDTYNNANGKGAENLAMSEFAKLLGTHKGVVIVALQDTGIRVPRNVSNDGIIKLIRANSNKPLLKKSLGALILANSEVNSYDHFLGKKKDGTPRLNLKNIGNIFKKKSKNGESGDKKGSWWSRVFKKDETTGKSKAGSWVSKNKSTITDLGNSLLSGLTKGNNSANVSEGADYHEENKNKGNGGNGGDDKKEGMSMMTKIGIGVGVLGIIALVVWKMRGKKGRK